MEGRRFYERCGRMLRDIKEKRTGIKTACYKTETPGKYMAVLTSVMRKYHVLDKVVDALQDTVRCRYTAVVLCYEILYGIKRERRDFNKKLVEKVKSVHKQLLGENAESPGAGKGSFPQTASYIRVNTLKASKDCVRTLMLENTIVPDVYKVLEHKVNWIKLEAYRTGSIFVQNLASCIPAYVLSPPKRATVIDACAAPGNKATHLAMLMQNRGRVFAVEKSQQRFRTLRETVEKSGAENIVTVNCDFLVLDADGVDEILSATHILVDPSCSGSGLPRIEDADSGGGADAEGEGAEASEPPADSRLRALADFQLRVLKKALGYPKVQKVVYSTCSVHEIENEAVVKLALKSSPEFCTELALPAWRTRGRPGYAFSDDVIRCSPGPETHGFFVASLVRKS